MKRLVHIIIMSTLLSAMFVFPAPARAVSPPEDNLAFNKPVIASSTSGSFVAARAVDYRFATDWRASVAGAGQWLQVDLGQAYPLTGVELRFHTNNTTRAYRIEVSDDALNWTTVVTAPGATTQQRYHPFSATARYVRWFLTSISGSGSGTPVRVLEFWVFGPPAEPLPPIPFVSDPPPPYLSTGFVRGADVSHLMQQEHYGAVYYDVDNVQKDALQILKNHGVNAIRIKIWNDPGNRNFNPANLHTPLGFNNAYWATRLAVRAREMGFRVMINFHYSDTWADPSKQFIPHEWLGLSVADTATALYDFTYETLQTMVDHGVTPEWVQIGNEIPGGMLWPLGRNNTTTGWNNLALFIKSGYAATKAVDPSIKVIIHYDNAGHFSQTQSYYDNMVARGVEWDVTALSYYPHWHGTFAQMNATMLNLASRYGKPVNIVEAAHPWTTQNFDETGNVLSIPSGFPYPQSVAGQIGYLNELVSRIKAVPNGLGEGLFYWEPTWTAVPGAGWAIGEGCGWENAALFNQNGVVLASMAALGNQAPVVNAAPPANINEGDTFSGSGSFTDAGVNTWTATVDYGDGSGEQLLALNANKTFNLNHTYAFEGVYTVTVTVTDDEGAVGAGATLVTVNNVGPQVSSDLASQSVQYTDAIQVVSISAVDKAVDLPLAASTQWSLDGGAFEPGLPSWLALTPEPCVADGMYGICTWKLAGTGPVPVQAGDYLIRTLVSDGRASSSTDVAITVTPEDAYLEYTGEAIKQINNELALRATVWDSAASGFTGANPESGPAATLGDITRMWIAFDIYSLNDCLSGAPLATQYAQVADTGDAGDGIGTASSTFTSGSEASFCVSARLVAGPDDGVNAWYAAGNAEAVLTFYQASGQFASGGGWITDPDGGKGNFGFNARYLPNGRTQGNMVYIYRGLYAGEPADFKIKSNAVNALAFDGAEFPVTAILQGKGTIQVNRSSDGAELYSEGNATFQATVVDSGETTGSGDAFSLVVYDRNGVVYKSVPATPLQGGNVVIHQ